MTFPSTRLRITVVGLAALILGAQVALAAPVASRTALDDYVAREDATYAWQEANRLEAHDGVAHILDLRSQTWRSEDELDRTEWQHWLTVVRPNGVTAKTAMLFVTGRSNQPDPPDSVDDTFVDIARATKSVVAVLYNVPNQPLEFGGDGVGRHEDNLLARSWNMCIDTGDPNWIGQFAMAKSAVRAMDAVQECIAEDTNGKLRIERFVVSGASKRGWTTWLTAIVDPRVAAIAPIVIDMLNLEESMRHHYAAYGFWSPALHDYVTQGIMARLGTPEAERIISLVDPYHYLDRLELPKFLINSAGDQFFVLDSSRFYYDDLPGEKHMRYVPNTGHGLGDSDAIDSLAAFYNAIVHNLPRPEFTWTFEGDDTVRVRPQTAPLKVLAWQATNPDKRDFRIDRLGPKWKSSELSPTEQGEYVARVPVPAKGWAAFFVELTFASGCQAPFKCTTAIRVVPETLPFAGKPLGNNLEPEVER